jgi:hypothetical protein
MIRKSYRYMLRYLGAILLIVGVVSVLPMNAAAQGSLTLSLDRNIGLGLGPLIQGSFTLRGSGPEEVQNLTVYFNGEQVHFVTGNTIAWQFNTGDYPSGSTNITLYGLDDTGMEYYATRQVTFIGGLASNLFTIGILAFVVIVVLAKYGPRLMKKSST